MPHQFHPRQFVLDTWRTDVRGSDFALVTTGSPGDVLENQVRNGADVFQQRHMVHCSRLGLTLDNSEIAQLQHAAKDGQCQLHVQAQQWPPPHSDTLLEDLDADILQHLRPEAQQQRPAFIWLSAVPDDAATSSLSDNLRGFLDQQLEQTIASSPAQAAALTKFVEGSAAATAHPTLRHPSWPSSMELNFEVAATHATAAAGASPPFVGDSPGGPLQIEFELAEVSRCYAAARACSINDVQLAVLGTRLFREKRQHILVMCTSHDNGLAAVLDRPLPTVQEYNVEQQDGAGEVVAQPDSDGHGMTWWVQSTMAKIADDQERRSPWKTVINVDPAAKGAASIMVAAHNLGNLKWDALDVALYLPEADSQLQLPISRAWLRLADVLQPTATGSMPRAVEARAPSVEAIKHIAACDVALAAAPELVVWLKENADQFEDVLAALSSSGALQKASPRKQSPTRTQQV